MFSPRCCQLPRAAQAAEAQASASKTDGLVKAMKVEAWKPATREEELKTWRDWYFQLTTWLIANDNGYEDELGQIDPDSPVDHDLLEDESVQRSQKLYGLLCSLLKGRPLLLIRSLEKEKAGYEALRILKREMEPKERARSLAITKQLASWQLKESTGLHEQLVAYEEALRSYEASSGNSFPDDLMVATVVTGLKEPLRSQAQLRMRSSTTYSDIREWILQYENVNALELFIGSKGSYCQHSQRPSAHGCGPGPGLSVGSMAKTKERVESKARIRKASNSTNGKEASSSTNGTAASSCNMAKASASSHTAGGKEKDMMRPPPLAKAMVVDGSPKRARRAKPMGPAMHVDNMATGKMSVLPRGRASQCGKLRMHSLNLGNRWRPLRQCQPVPLLTEHQAQCRGLKLFSFIYPPGLQRDTYL